MTTDIDTGFYTEDGVRVSVSDWDEGGAWLSLQVRGGSAYAALNRKEAEQLLAGLQRVLAGESVTE
jgi:hypothetical protein